MKITQLLLGRKFLFLAVGWTIIITALSLITIEKPLTFVLHLPFKDKIIHFIFYFVFVVLWDFGLKGKTNSFRVKILLVAVFYGIIIEVLQYAVTKNRTADFYDVLANSLGALFAFFVIPFLKRIFLKQKLKIKK